MITIERLARRRSAVTRTLASITALLVLVHLGWQWFKHWTGHDYVLGLIRLFHLNQERNVPSAFSALLLLSAAALLAYLRGNEKRRATHDVSKWTLLMVGFLYLAIDEFMGIHELLIVPGRDFLDVRSFGVVYYAWVIPALLIVLALGLYFVGFLRRLPATTALGFIAGGVLYVGGALGLELLGGRHAELYGERDFAYLAYITVEETLEMAGVITFIHALLRYIDLHLPAGKLSDPSSHAPSKSQGIPAGVSVISASSEAPVAFAQGAVAVAVASPLPQPNATAISDVDYRGPER